MKKILLFLSFIFILTSLSNIMALCDNGDVDINTASLEDLDKLSGIGPVKAQAIIDTRPFNSVDNLIDVNGIGNATLDKIKAQGLACVSGEENTQENQEEGEANSEQDTQDEENTQQEDTQQEQTQDEKETPVKKAKTTKEDISANEEEIKEIETDIKTNMSVTGNEIETIVLTSPNPKGIKSESDMEQLNKNKFAIYGIIVFCILLVVLFGFKGRKNEKNEFR